ncbi:GntR family transcriptional regulator [Amycolatopsis sp. NPDC001319]|uniref:GntR family transcriptional regulator n=1 Tax=unclassified Amycolatopsis TaxID=2618356 RepID=UPI00368C31A1
MNSVDGGLSLTEQTYESLRQAILSGELEPGRLYSARQLADMLQVSRTPVREALLALAAQSMVRFERNRGVRVLHSRRRDIEEVFELRIALEVPACADAAVRMTAGDRERVRDLHASVRAAAEDEDSSRLMQFDRAFHEAVLEIAGNGRLTQFVGTLRDVVYTRGLCTAGASRPAPAIVEEHAQILQAIETGDPAVAAAAMAAHLRSTANLLLQQEFGCSPGEVHEWLTGSHLAGRSLSATSAAGVA